MPPKETVDTSKVGALEASLAAAEASLASERAALGAERARSAAHAERAEECARDLQSALAMIEAVDERNKQLVALNERQRKIILRPN